MVIPTINNTSNRSPVDNNRRVKPSGRVDTSTTVVRNPVGHEDDTKKVNYRNQPGFVERRKSPDRRQESKRPMVDTRRVSDRRRSSRVDVEV